MCPTQHLAQAHAESMSLNSREETQVRFTEFQIKPNSFDRTVFKGNIKIYIHGSTWIWDPWILEQLRLEILSMLSHTTF